MSDEIKIFEFSHYLNFSVSLGKVEIRHNTNIKTDKDCSQMDEKETLVATYYGRPDNLL